MRCYKYEALCSDRLVTLREVAEHIIGNRAEEIVKRREYYGEINVTAYVQNMRAAIAKANISEREDITGVVAYAMFGSPINWLPSDFRIRCCKLHTRYPFMDYRTVMSAAANKFCGVIRYRPDVRGNAMWGRVGEDINEETLPMFRNYLASLPAIVPFTDKNEQEKYFDVYAEYMKADKRGKKKNDTESV